MTGTERKQIWVKKLYLERQTGYNNITIWSDDRYIIKNYIVIGVNYHA